MDLTEYLYKRIGERVASHRKKLNKTCEGYVYEIKLKSGITTGITRQNISSIEKGKDSSIGRSFLSNNQIIALSTALSSEKGKEEQISTDSYIKLLLGDQTDIEELLKILLLRCLLKENGLSLDFITSDSQKDLYQKSQYIPVLSGKNTERLGNLVLKFLLTHPALQKRFIQSVFYSSDNFPKEFTPFAPKNESHSASKNYKLINSYSKDIKKINSEIREWYISDLGDIVSVLLRNPENIIYLFDAFDKSISKIIDMVYGAFLDKFKTSLEQRGKNGASPKMIDYLDSRFLLTLISDTHIYYLLLDKLRQEELDKNTSLYQIQFLQSLQYQNLFLEKIYSPYQDTSKIYDEFKLYSDLIKIIKFYKKEESNSEINLYITDYIDDTNYIDDFDC